MTLDGKKRIYPLNALQTDIYEDACQCPTRTIVIVELHHMFFDGLSVKAAFNNIEDALHGRPVFQQGHLAAEFNEAEVATYGSEALYTEEQLNTFARLIGEFALKLAGADPPVAVEDIIQNNGLFIAMTHVPGAFYPHFCAWNPVLETFVPKMTLFPEPTPVY